MASRLKLHEELCNLLGSKNVYFNPPESLKLNYPCIKYSIAGSSGKRADDTVYGNILRYTIMVIVDDPDSDMYKKFLTKFPMCNFDRTYTSDNLNHFVLTLYY